MKIWGIEKLRHTNCRLTLCQLSTIYRALLHQNSMSYWKINTFPRQTDPLLIKHKSTDPTRSGQYELLRNQHIPRADRPLLIKHKSTEPYYNRTVWAIEKLTHTHGRQTPHKLSTGLQSLLHQDNMTYWKIETYHPAIQAQVYRDILDQDSMSY